jgi:hypothetical protein
MDYNWEKIKKDLYFVDGSFRDIYINNITENQWAKWVDYVNENFKISWNNCNKIDFEVIKSNWKENVHPEMAKIFIKNNIQVNCHFFGDFENDIDPNEIQNIDDHNCIINYMRNISEILDANVYLSSENSKLDNDNYHFKLYKDEIYGY